jgi:tetratricopeptide (TPR) repeat protein
LPTIARDRTIDLSAAVARYQQVLAADPDQWDALYLYGTALLQLGRLPEAIDVFTRAARLRPDIPDVQNNLAVAYQGVGEVDAAVRAYRSAIDLNPEFDLAHANLARLLESGRRFAEAEISLRRALRIKPAESAYHLQLARVLQRQEKDAEAIAVLQGTLRQQPACLDAMMALAAALVRQERLDEAADVYRAALAERPDFAEAAGSLAFVLECQGRLDEALAEAERAVALKPDYAESFNNLGVVLRSLHRLDDACAAFRRSLELSPQFALTEFNLGTTLLLAGRYAEGWPGYRQHARIAGTSAPGPAMTEWDGRLIPGQRLLVYADQGLGDTIQFVRFLSPCREKSQARVTVRCQPALRRLLDDCRREDSPGADVVYTNDDELPQFDWHVPVASLPGLLGATIADVGQSVPYLHPPDLSPRLARLIGERDAALRVGLVWQGNPRQTRDVVRSCPLEKLRPLIELPGIRFFSLQYGPAAHAQLAAAFPAGSVVDVGGRLADFADTAAVLGQLDLLITVDTAIAHLAGALGRPVWTMLCHTPDWRWHLDRADCPWYPTTRLFRQPVWGDWDTVVDQIRGALQTV